MASMAEDFWNKLIKPLLNTLSKKNKKDDGVKILDNNTMVLSKKEYDEELAIEIFMEEFDKNWVLLETKSQFLIKPKDEVDLKALEKTGRVRRIL